MNPFLRRATEYLRDTSAFLQIMSPEPLNTFIGSHRRVHDLLDFPVRLIGSPGTGKTMMASLLEYQLVEAILLDQSTEWNRSLAAALSKAEFVDDLAPRVAAVRIPMESEYRDYWELPYEDSVKAKLVLSLIQARAILGFFRMLTARGLRELTDIRVIPRQEGEARIAQIGGLDPILMRQRAKRVEELVYAVGASLVPPPASSLAEEVQAPYEPFEAIREFEIPWQGRRILLRPLVILDDVHSLHRDQFRAVFRALARREIRIGRWMLMRMDALSPTAVFQSADDDALPGLKRDRDYIDVVMEGSTSRADERKRFRRMASDMADRYLGLVDPIRERGYTSLRGLLKTEPPNLTKKQRDQFRRQIEREQEELQIPATRWRTLSEEAHRYGLATKSTDWTEDVELATTRILMHRHAVRLRGKTLSLFDDPDPEQPVTAKSQIAEGARVHLNHLYDRPLHFGLNDLCDAAGENAELFLQFAGHLVDRMETKVIRGQDAALTPQQQHEVLVAQSTRIVRDWSFPFARKVRGLLEALAAECYKNSDTPNAPLGPGANAIGITMAELDALLLSDSELPVVLKYAVAYGALIPILNYGQGSQKWCLLELCGPLCISYGLGLDRGNFLERTVKDLEALLEAGSNA